MNGLWGLPFLGLLLSIAVVPACAPRFWLRHMGTVALFWCATLVVPQAIVKGPVSVWHDVWHAFLLEYLPFVALLCGLYTAAGGILLRGGPAGTPLGNTAVLGLGVVLASFTGTTGAAMIIIQPLLHANAHRRRKLHLAMFTTVLVGNAGGALTPLGDPPLYIGLLRGVPFFWPTLHVLPLFLLLCLSLLGLFWFIDRHLAATEPPPPPRQPFRVRGWTNVGLVGAIIAAVLLQGYWRPGEIMLIGQAISLERLFGALVCLAVVGVSLWITAPAIRQANDFHWHPMIEVAVLFAGVFVTLVPVQAMLQAGLSGPLAPVLRLALNSAGEPVPLACFWLTGMLSAFLDNAPTYLVFFELARIDPSALDATRSVALQAISAGAVFFGALTYIGNAPNLMLRAVAAHRGVRMPGFFGFLGLSCALLLPLFALISLVFFV